VGVLIRDPIDDIVEVSANGVVVNVHVQPRAGATQLTGRHGRALKVRVTAPPVDGRATDAARRALADALGVAPAAVSLLSGDHSRAKRFVVTGLAPDDAIARIRALVAAAGV
jgi:uncharacterized protein (TIGR00251 family)